MDSQHKERKSFYDGKVCYCIEPGVVRNVGDTYTKFNENFWDNYPSNLNNTIEPDTIKLLLGRIMQYGYQGNISTSWRSQDAADADKMAHAAATQLLVWETVVGERDADFNHVSTGGKDTIKSTIGKNNPLYSRINSYYDSMVERVENGIVYTVEGNTSDSCAERHYAVGHSEILGYGMPAY